MKDMIIEGTSLIKYSGDEKHIVIPAEIREINRGAFKGTTIETIDFSQAINLFVIQEEAFSNCTQLKYAELPVGLKELGNRAFSGCGSLKYVYIPDTTRTFGKDIFAGLPKVIIVGEDDSRVKTYAESNSNCIFRTDNENVKQSLRVLDKKTIGMERREFNIFGVIIECSNTCVIYNDTITHYQELIRKGSLFKTLIKCFPTKIDQKASGDRYVKALEDTVKETNRRLNRYGILTRDGEPGADVTAIHEKLLNVFAAYLNAFIDAMREGTFNATRMSEKLYQEAEDSATGLSYGIIGGFGDLIAYDIDNFLTKNRQLNANLEKARRQTKDVFANMRTGIEDSAKEAKADLTPHIREWTNELLKALCNFELTKLEEAGIIDKDIKVDINPNKSKKYSELINTQPDGLQNAGIALRYNPLNKDVYKELILQGLDDENLYELAEYVGLADYYSAILKKRAEKALAVERLKKEEELAVIEERQVDDIAELLIAKKAGRSPLTSRQRLEKEKAELSVLQVLVQEFDNIKADVLRHEREIQNIEMAVGQLQARRASLGLFAGKEKKQIDLEIGNLESKKAVTEKEANNRRADLKGFSTRQEVELSIQTIDSRISELILKIQEMEDAGEIELSYEQAIRFYWTNESVRSRFNTKYPELAEPLKTIRFGNYYQQAESRKEPIDWIILDAHDNSFLLISKYALDCIPFNSDSSFATWETCSLRRWLNSSFISDAFSTEEQQIIQSIEVVAEKNLKYNTLPGNPTKDRVFLLSMAEVRKYFSSNDERMCRVTAYCDKKKPIKGDNGNCLWWLRSPGRDNSYAANVTSEGGVNRGGNQVNLNDRTVRPALWVDLGSLSHYF